MQKLLMIPTSRKMNIEHLSTFHSYGTGSRVVTFDMRLHIRSIAVIVGNKIAERALDTLFVF